MLRFKGPRLPLKKGSYRTYAAANRYIDLKVCQLNALDYLCAACVFAWYCISQWNHVTDAVTESERQVWDTVQMYLQGRFYLNTLCPGVPEIFAVMMRAGSLTFSKHCVLLISSGTLAALYLSLRRCSIPTVICGLCSLSLAQIPFFQEESVRLSPDALFWFSLVCTVLFWRSYRATDKLRYLFPLSLSLALGMNTKKLGFVTCLWIVCCSLLDTWRIIGDVTVSTWLIVKIVLIKFLFVIVWPLQLTLLVHYYQLLNFRVDSPEQSRYMSSDFQAYLRGTSGRFQHPDGLLHYGDTVTLRHLETLGGYLTSYDVPLKSGSGDQLVTLSALEDDPLTHWTLETKRNEGDGTVVKVMDHLRLRHVVTGRLLRSSEAKPAVSEQEYHKEVSCNANANYSGNMDELWRFDVKGVRIDEQVPVSSAKVALINVGRGCTILGHAINMPDWAFNDQEVVCLEFPTERYTYFELRVINAVSSDALVEEPVSGINPMRLMWEWIMRGYKYSYTMENPTGADTDTSATTVDSWPFYNVRGTRPMAPYVWYASTTGVILFSLWIVYQCMHWNPWSYTHDSAAITEPLSSVVLWDCGSEFALGWFLHFRTFSQWPSKAPPPIQCYIPSVMMGLLLISVIVGRSW
ncbi:putative dolichyl-phosphate-mannose--protein mannosyltransferase KNAG_0F03430 [Huiozyma naganishii CBS 8797]|uniref:dolichyl-phosphate-mannose--protein mannosyltransferase n=1 Tax=Huiozyma naganishii (strain ATCC MYA-139 / BCRC 22969 / CBS 8797 / KCTC 17520 / NBRC 10181 / NCYC 3082 / Yp74L-3) TaxID=1071383 RepID=J7R831_HUIN7|nr:hypothetical protein KNAG_0F03430 [Kazachstania naganishii CBS 8797]CCK71005.1 hypothetical protein KNAG_0F03430 [Kazachstania naganishii CBS 8797]